MTVPVKPEEPARPPYEPCCFCERPTPNWTAMKDRPPEAQVACCRLCANKHEPEDVPTKEDWCLQE